MIEDGIIEFIEYNDSRYALYFIDRIGRIEEEFWFTISVDKNISLGVEDEIFGYTFYTEIEDEIYIASGELFNVR